MAKVITKLRFLEHGSLSPRNSRFKGTITSEKLIGLFDYTSRDDSKDSILEINKPKVKSFFDYTSEKDGSISTYTSRGWLTNDEKIEEFKTLVSQSFNKDGHIAWDLVISLKDYEESFNYGLESPYDFAVLTDVSLHKFFKGVGLRPLNMLYWMDYHTDTDNPHIHVVFLEKDQTRSRGKFTPKEINRLNSIVYQEMLKAQEFKNDFSPRNREYLEQKDLLKKQLKEKAKGKLNLRRFNDNTINRKIDILYEKLPKKGRLQINSSSMKDLKGEVMEIVEDMLKTDELKQPLEDFIQVLDKLDENISEGTGRKNTRMKDSELGKLKTQMANQILQNFKAIQNDYTVLRPAFNHIKDEKLERMEPAQVIEWYDVRLKPLTVENPFLSKSNELLKEGGWIDQRDLNPIVKLNLIEKQQERKRNYLELILKQEGNYILQNPETHLRKEFVVNSSTNREELLQQLMDGNYGEIIEQPKENHNKVVVPIDCILMREEDVIIKDYGRNFDLYINKNSLLEFNSSYRLIDISDSKRLMKSGSRYHMVDQKATLEEFNYPAKTNKDWKYNEKFRPIEYKKYSHRSRLNRLMLQHVQKAQMEAEHNLSEYLNQKQNYEVGSGL